MSWKALPIFWLLMLQLFLLLLLLFLIVTIIIVIVVIILLSLLLLLALIILNEYNCGTWTSRQKGTCAQRQPPSCVLLSAGRSRTLYAAPSHLQCQDRVCGRTSRHKVLADLGCCTYKCNTCVMELEQECGNVKDCVRWTPMHFMMLWLILQNWPHTATVQCQGCNGHQQMHQP